MSRHRIYPNLSVKFRLYLYPVVWIHIQSLWILACSRWGVKNHTAAYT